MAELFGGTQKLGLFPFRNKEVDMIDQHMKKHQKKIQNIDDEISNANDKNKAILAKCRTNMIEQQNAFKRYINGICQELEARAMHKMESVSRDIERECMLFSISLPIYAFREKIGNTVKYNDVTIINGDACYGASLVLPLYLQKIFTSSVIACCEPNTISAVVLASRLSKLAGKPLGTFVGYQTAEHCIKGKDTKILFTTAQDLLSSYLGPSELSEFSCIIFDEFLTRTVETDLLLARILECLKTTQNIKVIIITFCSKNASKFGDYFCKFASVYVIETHNLLFPVGTIWKEASSTPGGDYKTEVVETALAIHVKNNKELGDILTFVPRAEDISKVSTLLMEKLKNFKYDDVECVEINENNIHNSSKEILQIMDKRQTSKRSIILSTNSGKILSFPTVRYVIDSGIIKALRYNSAKHTEIMCTSFISKIEAEKRKACAGRFGTGKCYRLYSKDNYLKNMMNEEDPESLNQDPFTVMLKVIQHGATSMKLIDSLDENLVENTLIQLENRGIIRNGCFTNLGEQMMMLPFNHGYSKLLVLGIERGFPFESVILVAFFSITGSVFKQEQGGDAAKLQFIQNDSDSLTFLKVFQDWKLNGSQGSWCNKNYIDFEFLIRIQKKIDEIIGILNSNLKQAVFQRFQGNNPYAIQSMLFESFMHNLCVSTGHFRSGYKLVNSHSIVFKHSSSVLVLKENLPKFIVFDHLQSTSSRDVMYHITSIPENLVMEATARGCLTVKYDDLLKWQLSTVVIEPVGVMIMKRYFLGKKGYKVRELEEFIKKETGSELVVIDPSVKTGSIALYTLPRYCNQSETIVRNSLKSILEGLRSETENFVVHLKKGEASVPINVKWTIGASVTAIDRNVNTNIDTVNGESSLKSSKGEAPIQFTVNLSWPQPKQCDGFGNIYFESFDFPKVEKLVQKTVRIRDCEVKILLNKKKKNSLYVRGLPPETTDADIAEALRKMLPLSVREFTAKASCSKIVDVTDNDVKAIRDQLKKECAQYETEVVLTKPKDSETIMKAYLNMKRAEDIELVGQMLRGRLKIKNMPVKVKTVYRLAVFLGKEILGALDKRLQIEFRNLKIILQNQFSLVDEAFRYETGTLGSSARIKILTNHFEVMKILQGELFILLEGEIINSSKIKDIQKLFTHGGHIWLQRLQKELGIHIMDEYKSKTVRLYGLPEFCEKAKSRIIEYITGAENEEIICLSANQDTRTLLKAIIREYDVGLEKLIEICDLRSAELNIRQCQLTLNGSNQSVKKAKEEIDKLAKLILSKPVDAMEGSGEMCPACLCPPEDESYRLEYCGHLYCLACVRNVVMQSRIPIKCCQEKCEKELIIGDIRGVLSDQTHQVDKLINQALEDFVNRNQPYFAYCPSPDCTMIFDKRNSKNLKWDCPLCLNIICTECKVNYHHGYTCEMYQGTKKDSDYSVKEWIKKDTKARKRCPKCRTAVEKIGGCNHMECINCHSHYCWLCIKAFPTGRDDNKHHQGVGLLLSTHASDALLGYECINERFLTAKFQTSVKDLNVICCYAPTEDADEDEKDRFYRQLQDILNSVKKGDITLVLGHFSAKVGTDSDLWRGVIGPFGISSCNGNGQRLLQVWMHEKPTNRKHCPVCKISIEKTTGCNHMICLICHSHFCWLCLKAFPTENDWNRHQPYCPRTS